MYKSVKKLEGFTMPKTIVTLSAETIDLIGNNKCGDSLYWYVNDENTLTIFGTGAMWDYDNSSNKAPWRNLNTAPTSLELKEGMTSIGTYAFYNDATKINLNEDTFTRKIFEKFKII